MSNVSQMVLDIKEANEDFEWYPTTPKILKIIKNDMNKQYHSFTDFSILDVGAGDGRALNALACNDSDDDFKKGKVKKFAIEKCQQLINIMPDDVFICGTDFYEQTLMDKPVDILFCNPPYKTFEEWIATIIRDSCATYLYFVIPTRWKRSKRIQEALDDRGFKLEVIGTDDFYNADRVALCEVDIIKCHSATRGYNDGVSEAFKLWFDGEFDININKPTPGIEAKELLKTSPEERIKTAMVEQKDIVSMLVSFYTNDMENIFKTYRGLEQVDADILGMLDVDLDKIRNALALKVKGLKTIYWQEAMNTVTKITDRFTSTIRRSVLEKIISNSSVDFTISNIHAVLTWLIKNVNKYADEQVTTTMERMIEKANVVAYKSNQRTFRDAQWRYNDIPFGLSHYKLELRIVLEGRGFSKISHGKLDDSTADFYNDLCAIAISVGFDTMGQPRSKDFEWEYGKPRLFTFKNHTSGKVETLFEAKRFKNGNMHIKFNKRFICALNVAFGRINGWVQSAQQAAEEMDISLDDASTFFNQQLKLTAKPQDMLSLPNMREAA